jgi:hypothetical protein
MISQILIHRVYEQKIAGKYPNCQYQNTEGWFYNGLVFCICALSADEDYFC